MKSKSLLFILTVLFSMSVYADFIPEESAKKVALNFFFEKYNQFEGQITFDQLYIRSIHTETGRGQNFYYVFQINGSGFIIVSADDRLTPVLGYSFKHDFVTENQPPNIQYWLGQYKEQVSYARKNKIEPAKNIADQWAYFLADSFISTKPALNSKEVEPLITTLWNQDWSYNYYCPEDPAGPGGHAYAGCGATALGQILFYWGWPDHGFGDHCYFPTIHPEYGEQCADFENTWYRWEDMIDEPTNNVNEAIAELLYHCGVSIDMDYHTSGGSAPIGGYYAQSHMEYFRFDTLFQIIYSDSSDLISFRETIRDNLDNKIPIPYAGGSEDYTSMHMFICDGYQDSLYFHFNMGWGGNSNGYYLVDQVFEFTSHKYYYSGLLPDTINNVYPLYASGADTLYYLEGSITDGSGPVNDYLNNTEASWLIDPQTEYDSITSITIMVKQLELFNDGDKLSIYDGKDNSAPLLAELTGNTIPEDIESTGNVVFIEFLTDGSNTAPGFYLNYKTERPVWCNGMTQITEATATINDGSNSFYYNNQASCSWIIDPGITDSLTLYFNYFDTEEENDVLRIIDGVSQDILAEISGHYDDPPEPVTSPGGKMLLGFFSNNSVRAQGWEVWYDINLGMTENLRAVNFRIIPNPVTTDVTISFNLQIEEQVSIKVYNIVGEEVDFFADKIFLPGYHSINGSLGHLPEGLYFIRLKAGTETITKKIIKIK